MLIGELLVKNHIITQTQLNQALKSHNRYPNHSIGQVVSKIFNISPETIETTLITKSIIPTIITWFQKNIARKTQKTAFPLSSSIKKVEIEISSYTRYEGEAVQFIRNEMGYYCEESRDTSLEKLALTLETIKITTIRKQEITLSDVHLNITLGSNEIKTENPGFLAEARLKLLHALKQKGTTLK